MIRLIWWVRMGEKSRQWPVTNCGRCYWLLNFATHDDIIKLKHFPRYWPFLRGIHRSPVNSPHKGQWRGALKFTLICARINGWVNNREAGDLRRYRAHYDVIVMREINKEITLSWAHKQFANSANTLSYIHPSSGLDELKVYIYHVLCIACLVLCLHLFQYRWR